MPYSDLFLWFFLISLWLALPNSHFSFLFSTWFFLVSLFYLLKFLTYSIKVLFKKTKNTKNEHEKERTKKMRKQIQMSNVKRQMLKLHFKTLKTEIKKMTAFEPNCITEVPIPSPPIQQVVTLEAAPVHKIVKVPIPIAFHSKGHTATSCPEKDRA